jgi:prepilin-type N-terminal cleavage/methylation domain-containing protein
MLSKMKFKNSNSGFTLLEAIVAISVISIGVVGVMNIVPQLFSAISINSSRLTAAYLAQEGIEIVRNIRDTNWLQARDPTKSSPWDDGLVCASPPCEWQGDYTTVTFTDTEDFEKCTDSGYNCHPYDDARLKIDGGFYRYSSSGTETPFRRKITIEPEGSDILKITVEVSWEERGRSHSFSVQENLYKWQ